MRSIETDDKKMNRIFLRMGQSTVLRFNDDRPKKVVIGNQNYYNVEFVEGTSDVTLQPLQTVPTNLFVYCQKKTYGFLITTKNYGKYDDLVNVFWKPPRTTLKVKGKIVVIDKKNVNKLNKKIKVGNSLLITNLVSTSYKRRNTIILDFNLRNTSTNKIDLKELEIYVTRSNKKLENQTFIINESILQRAETTKVRLIVNLKHRRGFTLNTIFKDQTGKLIIGKRYLK